jgi:hypothetical protein
MIDRSERRKTKDVFGIEVSDKKAHDNHKL